MGSRGFLGCECSMGINDSNGFMFTICHQGRSLRSGSCQLVRHVQIRAVRPLCSGKGMPFRAQCRGMRLGVGAHVIVFFTKGIRNCHTCQSEDSACVFFFVHPCLMKEVLFAFVCPHSWHHYCTIRLGLVGAFTVICRCSMEVTVEIYDDL